MRIHRSTPLLLLIAALAVIARPAGAQAPEPMIRHMTVTSDNVYVRTGPSVESEYPFGKLKTGAVVRVVDERFGWARVATIGPAFSRMFGYVNAGPRVRIEADGRTGTITARTEVLAPQLTALDMPDRSWGRLAALKPGDTVVILATVTGRSGDVHKVALPKTGNGWINLRYLRAATEAEKTRFLAGIGATPSAGDPAPAAPLARDPAPVIPTPDPEPILEPEPEPIPDPEPVVMPEPEVIQDAAAGRDDEPSGEEAELEASEDVLALEALDDVLRAMLKEPVASAEFEVLRAQYLAIANDPEGDEGVRRYATARARQLEIRTQVQERLRELRMLRARVAITGEAIDDVQLSMEADALYNARGRLMASTVYDGRRLPRLVRVVNTRTGHTIAYMRLTEEFDLIGLLGQNVGVVGEKIYDGNLRLNLITPIRIDLILGSSGR